MGSAGDCYDSAMAESFFATQKTGLLNRMRLFTPKEARRVPVRDRWPQLARPSASRASACVQAVTGALLAAGDIAGVPVAAAGVRAAVGVPTGNRAGRAAGGGASRLAGGRVRMAAGGVPHLILREVRHWTPPEAEGVRVHRLFRRGRRSGRACRGFLHGSHFSVGSRPLAGRHDRRPRTAGNCKVSDGPLSVNCRSGTGRNNRIVRATLRRVPSGRNRRPTDRATRRESNAFQRVGTNPALRPAAPASKPPAPARPPRCC